jgi:hypothetical protein
MNFSHPTVQCKDIHTGNIVFNHSNRRPPEIHTSEQNTLIIPFHSTFDCRMAFIDFECAVHFPVENGVESKFLRPNRVPPDHTAAPEQLKARDGGNSEGYGYDMFAADVFNLGRSLQREILKAFEVSEHDYVSGSHFER